MTPTCKYSYAGGGTAAGTAPYCSGPVEFMVHDKRGCATVCRAHAEWMRTTSQAFGHSKDCPFLFRGQWQRVTGLP